MEIHCGCSLAIADVGCFEKKVQYGQMEGKNASAVSRMRGKDSRVVALQRQDTLRRHDFGVVSPFVAAGSGHPLGLA